MDEKLAENLQKLCTVLSAAKKACDDAWSKLSPERKAKIRDNILKKVEARIKAKQEGGSPC